jgi:hypothetical protein
VTETELGGGDRVTKLVPLSGTSGINLGNAGSRGMQSLTDMRPRSKKGSVVA